MALLKFWTASEVYQDADGSYGSPVAEDFGIEYGPGAQVDTIQVNRPQRYNGVSGWIQGSVPFYAKAVITEGVRSYKDMLAVAYPITPALSIVECVAEADVMVDIHEAVGPVTGSHYRVLAAVLKPGEDPAEAPPWLDGVGPDVPFSPARWTQVRNGLVNLGVPAQTVDNWRTNNPDGTPREFFLALQQYIQGQVDAMEAAEHAAATEAARANYTPPGDFPQSYYKEPTFLEDPFGGDDFSFLIIVMATLGSALAALATFAWGF